MRLTREELKMCNNNVMTVMENHIMAMTRCDRMTANLVANEVLNLDRDAEYLFNNTEDEQNKLDNEEVGCNTCKHYIKGTCILKEEGCQTEMMECYESR